MKIDVDDIVGKQMGELKVVKYIKFKNKKHYYQVACSCGIKEVCKRDEILPRGTKRRCLKCQKKYTHVGMLIRMRKEGLRIDKKGVVNSDS